MVRCVGRGDETVSEVQVSKQQATESSEGVGRQTRLDNSSVVYY
jgi:hypothetical protein